MSEKSKQTINTLALGAALPMARTTQVESRLHMILKPNISRRALTRRAVLLAVLPATAAVGLLAALRPAAQAQAVTTPGQPPNTTQKPPATMPSEIIGITNPAMPGQGWWDRNGKPIPTPSFGAAVSSSQFTAKPGDRPLLIAFHVPKAQEEIRPLYDISGKTQGGLTMIQTVTNPRRKMSTTMQSLSNRIASDTSIEGAAYPISLQRTKIRIGTASDPWTTAFILHYQMRGNAATITTTADYYGSINISGTELKYSLPLKNPDDFYDLRLTAISEDGQATLLPAIRTQSKEGREETVVPAPNNLPQIREVRIETRPFAWTVYDNVALYPSTEASQ